MDKSTGSKKPQETPASPEKQPKSFLLGMETKESVGTGLVRERLAQTNGFCNPLVQPSALLQSLSIDIFVFICTRASSESGKAARLVKWRRPLIKTLEPGVSVSLAQTHVEYLNKE